MYETIKGLLPLVPPPLAIQVTQQKKVIALVKYVKSPFLTIQEEHETDSVKQKYILKDLIFFL